MLQIVSVFGSSQLSILKVSGSLWCSGDPSWLAGQRWGSCRSATISAIVRERMWATMCLTREFYKRGEDRAGARQQLWRWLRTMWCITSKEEEEVWLHSPPCNSLVPSAASAVGLCGVLWLLFLLQLLLPQFFQEIQTRGGEWWLI